MWIIPFAFPTHLSSGVIHMVDEGLGVRASLDGAGGNSTALS